MPPADMGSRTPLQFGQPIPRIRRSVADDGPFRLDTQASELVSPCFLSFSAVRENRITSEWQQRTSREVCYRAALLTVSEEARVEFGPIAYPPGGGD
jgi:hypothetical protein